MTNIENKIYDKLKELVDLYQKKGISATDMRKHFINRRNFRALLSIMKDLQFVYDKENYSVDFNNFVHNILFFRILNDRIYFEKDNPKNETFLLNYDKFINEAKEEIMPKKEEKVDGFRVENISTRELRSIVADYEHKAKKVDDKSAKNYLDMAARYQEELDRREKKLYDDFMKNVDSKGYWISKKKN